ncbi:MAG: ACT domain-containing protein [Nitrososphaeria archaeon]|jgi:hypothetical protein
MVESTFGRRSLLSKSKRILREAFAIIKDRNEITVIIEQSKVNIEDVIEMKRNYVIISFDMTLPFELVRILARISKALADQNISIFTLSAYSTDHILVKEERSTFCDQSTREDRIYRRIKINLPKIKIYKINI